LMIGNPGSTILSQRLHGATGNLWCNHIKTGALRPLSLMFVVSTRIGHPPMFPPDTSGIPSVNLSDTSGIPSVNLSDTSGIPSVNLSDTSGITSVNLSDTSGIPSVNLSDTSGIPSVNLPDTSGIPPRRLADACRTPGGIGPKRGTPTATNPRRHRQISPSPLSSISALQTA
jgi:hypothetical protein